MTKVDPTAMSPEWSHSVMVDWPQVVGNAISERETSFGEPGVGVDYPCDDWFAYAQ